MNIRLRIQYGLSMWASLLVILGASHSHASDVPDYTADTDQKRSRIDRLPSREVKKSLLTGTDGGGALSAFWYEGQIRHVKVTIGMSNRQIEENYYYEDGRLIFAASKQSFFLWDQEAQRLDPSKIAMSFEDRFYFVDGKLKQWNTSRAAEDLNQNSDVAKENENVLKQSGFFMQAARDEKDRVDVEEFIKRGIP